MTSLASAERVAVALGGLEPGGVDVVDAEGGVGAREVGAVHRVGVDGRQDLSEVAALGHHRHAAVDQRAAAQPAALVDPDAGEALGVEHAGVSADGPVRRDAQDVADGLVRAGAQPVRAPVRVEHVAEDVAVRAGRLPGHPHLHDAGGDAGPGQAQRGDRAAVAAADDQGGHVVAGRQGGARGGRPGERPGRGGGDHRRAAPEQTTPGDRR
jgi:hypothetical protein